MLTGDRVDNITGIKGIGLKKSDKLLDNTPREEWDKMIIDLYMKEFDNGFQRCVENTQLLWMLQRDVEMPMDFINYEKTKSKATK
jgi:5'-3' exonuclease